jgi:hypothetical protein
MVLHMEEVSGQAGCPLVALVSLYKPPKVVMWRLTSATTGRPVALDSASMQSQATQVMCCTRLPRQGTVWQ